MVVMPIILIASVLYELVYVSVYTAVVGVTLKLNKTTLLNAFRLLLLLYFVYGERRCVARQ